MKKMVFGIALILFGLSMAYLSLQADWAIMQALSILPVFIGLVFQFLDLMRKINKPVIVEPMMKGGSILLNAPALGCSIRFTVSHAFRLPHALFPHAALSSHERALPKSAKTLCGGVRADGHWPAAGLYAGRGTAAAQREWLPRR